MGDIGPKGFKREEGEKGMKGEKGIKGKTCKQIEHTHTHTHTHSNCMLLSQERMALLVWWEM